MFRINQTRWTYLDSEMAGICRIGGKTKPETTRSSISLSALNGSGRQFEFSRVWEMALLITPRFALSARKKKHWPYSSPVFNNTLLISFLFFWHSSTKSPLGHVTSFQLPSSVNCLKKIWSVCQSNWIGETSSLFLQEIKSPPRGPRRGRVILLFFWISFL